MSSQDASLRTLSGADIRTATHAYRKCRACDDLSDNEVDVAARALPVIADTLTYLNGRPEVAAKVLPSIADILADLGPNFTATAGDMARAARDMAGYSAARHSMHRSRERRMGSRH
jgi:hypothetical protein